MGDRTAKSKLVKATDTQFADDVALYSSSHSNFKMAAKKFVEVAKK